jgi:hypothetical protein
VNDVRCSHQMHNATPTPSHKHTHSLLNSTPRGTWHQHNHGELTTTLKTVWWCLMSVNFCAVIVSPITKTKTNLKLEVGFQGNVTIHHHHHYYTKQSAIITKSAIISSKQWLRSMSHFSGLARSCQDELQLLDKWTIIF